MISRTTIAIVTIVLLMTSTSAHALRCGRNLVKTDMHEAEVIKICGNPTTARDLGYAVRGTFVPIRRHAAPGMTIEHYPGYGHYREEVLLTEYVYNFGPRKLMRRLLFEAGILVRIETIGYGYHEKKNK